MILGLHAQRYNGKMNWVEIMTVSICDRRANHFQYAKANLISLLQEKGLAGRTSDMQYVISVRTVL